MRPSILLASAGLLFVMPSLTSSLPLDGGPPRVQICGRGGGEVSREAIEASPDLALQGCVAGARILEFEFTCSKAKGATISWKAKGSRLNAEMLKTIAALPNGASFTITGLRVVDGKGDPWEVPAATFVLKA